MTGPTPLRQEAVGEGVAPDAEVIAISDRVLLERHVRGDREAFATLVRTHAPRVYGYLARAGVSPSDRDDLFQDVFCKVHRASLKQLPDGNVRAWILAIAVNAHRDFLRRRKVRGVVKSDDDLDQKTEHADPSPERQAETRQKTRFVEDAMQTLPDAQREALLLCTVEGLSLGDAARALDVPTNTVKTRLRRARLALAEAMRRRQLRQEREVSR